MFLSGMKQVIQLLFILMAGAGVSMMLTRITGTRMLWLPCTESVQPMFMKQQYIYFLGEVMLPSLRLLFLQILMHQKWRFFPNILRGSQWPGTDYYYLFLQSQLITKYQLT